MEKKKIVNLTPHPIIVRLPDGSERTFEPSDAVARVEETRRETFDVDGVPTEIVGFGDVDFGCELQPQTAYIVSALVLGAVGEVDLNGADLVAPDTGRAIRDEGGRVVAVPGFVVRTRP